jgi:hypothetical protein
MKSNGSRLAAGVSIAVTGALVAGGGVAGAKIKALPSADSQFRKGATRLAKSIAAKPKQVVRGRFSLLPPGGRPVAVATTKLAGFPRKGKSYGILTSGDARLAARKNKRKDSGRGAGGPFVRGTRDTVIFRLDLRVPKNASCLSFRFKFLTEEYPEFVNDVFNDAFIAEFDTSSWNSTSNEDPTIVSPDNFAVDSQGNRISVNATGDTTLSAENAKGTTYDGATRVLRASTPVKSGRHELYLSIFDQGDRQYDSAVFVDNLTLDTTSPCTAGVVVDE